MKIKTLKVKNFRGYKNEVKVDFENLTAIVGKNDIGKSTLLEALEIFFFDGRGLIKLDKDDINKYNRANGDNDIQISVTFTDLPEKVIIDESNETTLKDEYLLNSDNNFEITKIFKNASTTTSSLSVLINAKHPTNPNCNDLLLKKQKELNDIVTKLNLECDNKSKNSSMRKSIWNHFAEDLQLRDIEIDVNKKDGEIKAIWEKLQKYMPYFSLFQSDRKNSDGDSEVQDPLKTAVKQIMSDPRLQEELDDVANKVRSKLREVANLTLDKIREMNPEIAQTLNPIVPNTENLKWADVFKGLSITGDEDIPINKRGSGVKRLILINFFRAEAERRQKEKENQNIIYAIEEPETAQHKAHQKMLIDALKSLSISGNAQIIITTHSSDIVKALDFTQLKLACSKNGEKTIKDMVKNTLPYPSLNEVSYLAFEDISEEYHNELYGHLQSIAMEEDSNNGYEKNFDDWLESKGCKKSKRWIPIKNGKIKEPTEFTLCTYIRNAIHHPENKLNTKYSSTELQTSINEMRRIVISLNA